MQSLLLKVLMNFKMVIAHLSPSWWSREPHMTTQLQACEAGPAFTSEWLECIASVRWGDFPHSWGVMQGQFICSLSPSHQNKAPLKQTWAFPPSVSCLLAAPHHAWVWSAEGHQCHSVRWHWCLSHLFIQITWTIWACPSLIRNK